MDKIRRRSWWRALRGVLSLTMVALAIYFLAARANEIKQAWGLVQNARWRWLGAAVLFELASMVVFARLQRGLLRAGGVWLPLRTMVEITLAGNAVAADTARWCRVGGCVGVRPVEPEKCGPLPSGVGLPRRRWCFELRPLRRGRRRSVAGGETVGRWPGCVGGPSCSP